MRWQILSKMDPTGLEYLSSETLNLLALDMICIKFNQVAAKQDRAFGSHNGGSIRLSINPLIRILRNELYKNLISNYIYSSRRCLKDFPLVVVRQVR